jgi:hypothetical protein
MSGMLIEAKGEQDPAEIIKSEEDEDEDYAPLEEDADNEDELGDLLDDNEFQVMNSSKLGFLLDDITYNKRLSYLDDPNEDKNMFNSLMDIEFDREGVNFGEELEDPF